MSQTSNQNKKAIVLAGVVIVLALAVLVSWASFRPRALESVKTLSVSVTHGDGSVISFEMETTARYLDEALASRALLDIAATGAGPLLLGVDGEYASTEDGTYWLYTVNSGEAAGTIDAQPITDGDSFDFYLLSY